MPIRPSLTVRSRTTAFISPHLLLFAVCLLTCLAYGFGLQGPFLFDDQPNIVQNTSVHVQTLTAAELERAATSYPGSPLFKRPISMLTFGLSHYLGGLDPYGYKLANLLLHVANGIAIFVLTQLLLRGFRFHRPHTLQPRLIPWISLLVSSLWLLHPLNLTSVLYVVQRMNSLSAFFVLLGLIIYLQGRLRMLAGKPGLAHVALATLVCGSLAFLSKENGALLPLFLFVVEAIVLRFSSGPRSSRWTLPTLFSLLMGLPLIAAAAFLVLNPEWLTGSYANRSFTLFERIMTEPRVIWFYLKMILLPRLSDMGLYHDDIPVSTDLWSPPTTITAIAGLAGLLAVALFLRTRIPILSFGILFFFAGHTLESTILSLELAHEHRNYLPLYGIVLPLSYGIATLHTQRWGKITAVAALALVGMMWLATASRAHIWSDPLSVSITSVRNHPHSARSHIQLGQAYATLSRALPEDAKRYIAAAVSHFERAAEVDPYERAGSLVAALQLKHRLGDNVDPYLVKDLEAQLREFPLSSYSIEALVHLASCQAAGDCSLPRNLVGILLANALANPSINKSQKGALLASGANLAHARGEPEVALSMAKEAMSLAPEQLQHQLNVSKLLILLGRLNEAEDLLAATERADRLSEFSDQVRRQKQLLIQHRGQYKH